MALLLGEMLIRAGRITEEQLKKALEVQKESGGKLGEVLLELGYIEDENVINEFVAKQLNVGSIKLADLELDPEVVSLIPVDIARKFTVIATIKVGKLLFVATEDPSNLFVLDTLKFVTNHDIQPVMTSKSAIQDAIERYYGTDEETVDDILEDMATAEDLNIVDEEEEEISDMELQEAVLEKPLVKLVNSIIMNAIRRKASDIHIETYEKRTRLRYRIDGDLVEQAPLPYNLRHAVVSRIKIMAKLNISERRVPQDGRIKIHTQGRAIDFRVSILPCIFGEKVVMRLLDPENLMLDISKLGFPKRALKEFNKAIHLPFGMVLVTGPTGSGKTTTLYSALSQLNTPDTNIMTAEDPVEYNIKGLNQVHMHAEIGLTFAEALRGFLRQDPDVILVGEIRDGETASIAIKAALTGHLVFSTLHTNDAPSAVTRLVDMGVPPFLVAGAVKLIMAQRLVRKICPNCKVEMKPEPEYLEIIGMSSEDAEKITFYKGEGCPMCNGSGYKGRIACFEIMPISRELKKMILAGAASLELTEQAAKEGMRTLRQEAIRYMIDGITTIEQVITETASH
ncbi:type IV-A pilus assembly ATPase PilB [bacterium]|nr:MAG: type IV-A pilus assembly ATPase PilB [bacterium]